MSSRLNRIIERLLTNTGQQLGLCCHRDVGNLPLEILQRNGTHAGRLR